MNKKQSEATRWLVLFLLIPALSCAAEPIIINNVHIMPEIFSFEGRDYVVSNDFNAENNITIKYDFNADDRIETLLGFQARTNDEVGVPLSFLVLGKEENKEFKPLHIISGNDYYNKLELLDIDSDNLPEILFWSNGGAHHVDLSIYKIKNNRLNKIFKIGSACGINVTPKSNPLRIKVGIPKFDKPGWSYADEPDWEMWIWNGKRFSKETTVITNYNKNK